MNDRSKDAAAGPVSAAGEKLEQEWPALSATEVMNRLTALEGNLNKLLQQVTAQDEERAEVRVRLVKVEQGALSTAARIDKLEGEVKRIRREYALLTDVTNTGTTRRLGRTSSARR